MPLAAGLPSDRPTTAARRLLAGPLPPLLLTALTVAVRAWNPSGFPFPNDDEGTYAAQAWAASSGLGFSHYTYWYDHPPLAWLQLSALSWLPARLAPEAPALVQGRLAMLPVAAVTALLIGLVARRLGLHPVTAAGAMLLNALSPLAVALQRQVYLDSFALLWILAAFALALSPRRHLWHHVAAGTAFALAVLSKETIAVLLPALLLALWRNGDRRIRWFSLAAFASGALLLLCYPLYAALKKELLPGDCHVSLLSALVWQIAGRGGSGSVFETGTVAHTLIGQWLEADPVLLVGGTASGFAALAVRRLRPLGVAVVLLVLVVVRPGGYLPKMYAVQTLPFLALALAGMAERALRAVRRHGRTSGPSTGASWRGRLLPAVAAVCLTALAVPLAPLWYSQLHQTLHADLNGAYREASQWLHGQAVTDKRRTRLVTDGVLWLDAVAAGFTPGAGAVWHYKLDKDPAIVASMPRGWRDIDYVLATPTMREAQGELPTLRILLRRGEPVAEFGHGQIQVLDIRDAARHAPDTPGPAVPDRLAGCVRGTADIWPYP